MSDFYFQTRVLELLESILKENQKMSINLDTLVTEVAQTMTVEQSAIVLLNDLVQRLGVISAQLANEPAVQAQLDELTAELDAREQALAAAIAAVPTTP